MKKNLLIAGILVSSVTMANGNVIEVRLGGDLKNTYIMEHNGKREEANKSIYKNGIEVVTEYRKELLPNFELGGGVAGKRATIDRTSFYEELKKEDPNPTNKLDLTIKNIVSVPVYVVAKYNFNNSTSVKPYVKAKLGHAFNKGGFSAKLKKEYSEMEMELKFGDGDYLGLGAGVEIKNFVVDLSYNSTNMRVSKDVKQVNHSAPREPEYILPKEPKEPKDNLLTLKNHSVTLSVGYLFKF